MTKEQIIKKFTSRKFLLTLIANLAAIIAIIVGDHAIVDAVAGLVMAVVTVVYCVIEGKLDAASLKTVTDATAKAAEAFGADEKTVNKIEDVGDAVGVLLDGAKVCDTEDPPDAEGEQTE